ncbi:MAG TPA: protein kinase [Pyrinomonadaceae bacterium]|nr:protein kinase [Pyrinomonadaceae bacterium]
MASNDWRRVEELFHAALELGREERDDYLASACSGDETLRREVESLVTSYESQQSFIERPALTLGMQVISEGLTEPLTGKAIGHYKILRPLGRGGMGHVYLAEDTKLERDVALKFLANRFFDDEWAREQLTKEARAVAKLEHENICTVYDIEEIDGYNFIVMHYVEGETLGESMRGGPLPSERVLDLAEQMAGALAAAHARGVVHRDIKPQNVVVTPEGKAKVLDFGLAKFVRQQQELAVAVADANQTSTAGLVIGTVAYMSPEQVRAEAVDHRTDIFSFGIVLHEMLCGTNPFRREGVEDILRAIKEDDPPAPHAETSDATREGLRRVALRCLEKERGLRYQTAAELLQDLREVRGERERERDEARRAATHAPTPWGRRRFALALVALVAVALAAFVAYFKQPTTHTLAVLPFANESGDASLDYLSEGLAQNMTRNLSRLSELKVKPQRLVSIYKDAGVDPAEAARQLGVESVLVGKLVRKDEALYLDAYLVNADGKRLWFDTFEVRMAEVIRLQDDVARGVVTGLRLSLPGDDAQRLARHQTNDAEALRLYMLGQYYWTRRNKENIRTAIRHFHEAVERDPLFAQAHAALADSYVFLPTVAFGHENTADMYAKARAAAKRALEIDNLSCEAHMALGVVMMRHDWDWAGAEAQFRKAIELKPDSASPHYWYSQLLMITGRADEALRESELNRKYDPFSSPAVLNVARAHYFARRYGAAADICHEELAKNPDNDGALYILGLSYWHLGARRDAVETLQRMYAVNPIYAAAALGHIYGKTGREVDALAVLGTLEERSKDRPVPAQEKAIIYIGLGDKNRAFAYLEEAYEERFPSLISLLVEPLFDDLRTDPRYLDLASRMNLNP